MLSGGVYKSLAEDQMTKVARCLWDAFLDLMAVYMPDKAPQPSVLAAQRWGSGFKSGLVGEKLFEFDSQNNILVCGDFFSESNAEGAIASGLAAAEALKASLA
jgi:predicted NAD/FAD-dependent oxidoreductase